MQGSPKKSAVPATLCWRRQSTACPRKAGSWRRRLASAPAQAALRAGDDAGLARAIGQGWKDASPPLVLAADLDAAYGVPAEFGFSKLALLEAALSQGKPVARVVREGKESRLGLAAAAGAGKVVYLHLPLSLLTSSFDQASVPGRGYVGAASGRLHDSRTR